MIKIPPKPRSLVLTFSAPLLISAEKCLSAYSYFKCVGCCTLWMFLCQVHCAHFIKNKWQLLINWWYWFLSFFFGRGRGGALFKNIFPSFPPDFHLIACLLKWNYNSKLYGKAVQFVLMHTLILQLSFVFLKETQQISCLMIFRHFV